MNSTAEHAKLARILVRSVDGGVLSTMSSELPGYPFGSVTPYVTTPDGRVVIYISDIAQHTANIRGCSRVCLTVAAEGGDANRQARGRVSIVGDAAVVADIETDSVAARYFAFFPEARAYAGTHGFHFYAMDVKRVRYIGGFGRISWVEPEDWRCAPPEWVGSEDRIVGHMNDDHRDALQAMAKHFFAVDDEASAVEMVALDTEGFHLRTSGTIHYLSFDEAVTTSDAVRKTMVALTQAARSD